MIYQLIAPQGLALPASPFSSMPSAGLGFAIWLLFSAAAIVYAMRAAKDGWRGMPMLLATGIYTGLFLNLYQLVDEVMINLEHSYNLKHFGKFSMSSTGWVDGTVEMLYYLLHAPFAWSQQSLVIANFAISFAIGWLHLWLIARLFRYDTEPSRRTFALCGFALCSPLIVIFSSGFGNGLVSLVFLAAIVAAAEGRTGFSLALSGLLPLIRPDAAIVSVANIGVLAFRRSIQRKHLALLLAPAISMGIYYACYWQLYGHWIPTPVRFKTLTPVMLAMTDWFQFVFNLMLYVAHPAHVIGVTALVFAWRAADKDSIAKFLAPYALATLPLLVFYNFTRATVGDFSFQTYPRYWVSFEVVLAAIGAAHFAISKSLKELRPIVVLLVAGALFLGGLAIFDERGREDSAFAGGFTERYLPANLKLATSEMNTFGFMIERPLIDLWGYTTAEIAFSKVCNADRIRSNPAFFLSAAPDVYWPYWFTRSMSTDERGGFENAEAALAIHHHTSRRGNLLGDMREVLKKYDVVVIDFPGRPKLDRIGYLVRHEALGDLLGSLREKGIAETRQRPIDTKKFEEAYGKLALKQYRCN